jgi:hypothetical protein
MLYHVKTITQPTPIEEFGNPKLRDSINAALAGVDPGHGGALLHLDNGGAGFMVVQRIGDKWSAIAGARYNFDSKKFDVQVDVVGSWP